MQLVVAPEAVANSGRVELMAGTAHCRHTGNLHESEDVVGERNQRLVLESFISLTTTAQFLVCRQPAAFSR